MSRFRIDVQAERAKKALRNRLERVLAVPVALVEVAEEARQRIASLTPTDQDSGGPHTAQLWELRPERAPARVTIDHPFNREGARHPATGEVVNDSDHNLLATLEYGSKPHSIEPKDPGGRLHFEVDGEHVSAKRVEHPGTRPHAMVRTTAAEVDRDLVRRIKELLRR